MYQFKKYTNIFFSIVSSSLILSSCSTLNHTDRSPAYFIGGEKPKTFIPGIVKLGSDHLLKECTATLVSSTHILTAAHCWSHNAAYLVRPSEVFPAAFREKIQILTSDDQLQTIDVVVKKMHLYADFYYGGDEDKVKGDNDGDIFGHIVEVGDFAVVELVEPLPIKKIPQILIQKSKSLKPIWVGGFGKKALGPEKFLTAEYTGAFARLGDDINSFYIEGETEFKKQSPVSTEMINLGNEISFVGKGDSGGGVFQDGYVIGVNHAGFYGNATGLQIDPQTGKVLKRPAGDDARMMGYVHRFTGANKKLVQWITKVLPKSSYVIEK